MAVRGVLVCFMVFFHNQTDKGIKGQPEAFIVARKREFKKCLFCENESRHAWHGRYGTVYLCDYCYDNMDILEFGDANVEERYDKLLDRR